MFNGEGIYQEANGDYYIGNFKNNKFDGYGKYIMVTGKVYEGIFSGGHFPEKYLQGNIFTISKSVIPIFFIISLLCNIVFILKIIKILSGKNVKQS